MSSNNDGARAAPLSSGTATAGTASPPAVRNNNNNNRRGIRHNNNNPNRRNVSSFEGRERSLKGFIYDFTGERNPEQWIKTTKEIVTYVGRTYNKFTTEFTEAVRDLTLADPVQPQAPDPTDVIAFEIWKIEIKEYRTKAQEYDNFRAGLYNLVLGQCSEALEDRLKSHQDFHAAAHDGIALLKII